MEYDDWIASDKSTRVWLADSMTALGQFAYVTPIPRVMHYNKHTYMVFYFLSVMVNYQNLNYVQKHKCPN